MDLQDAAGFEHRVFQQRDDRSLFNPRGLIPVQKDFKNAHERQNQSLPTVSSIGNQPSWWPAACHALPATPHASASPRPARPAAPTTLSCTEKHTHTYITELWGHQWKILKPKDDEIVKILVLSYLCKQQQVKVWIPKLLVVSDLLSECSRAFFFPLHLLGLQQLHGEHELLHLALQLLHLGARVVVLQPEPPAQEGRALRMWRRHRRARLGGLHSGPVECWRCG